MAERRFFDSWSADRATPPPPPYPPASSSGAGVIGLFPEPGGGR
jgi:hypothetical protein